MTERPTLLIVAPDAAVYDLAVALSARWRVVLALGDAAGGWPGASGDGAGLRIHQLPGAGRPSGLRRRAALRRHLRSIIETEAPALVTVHAPAGGLATLLPRSRAGIPLVVSWHGGPGRAIGRRREQRMLARAAWVICPSDELRDTELAAVRAKSSTVPPGLAEASATSEILEAVLAGQPGDGRRRLAVVAPYFHPRTGGVEQYAYQVALGLSRPGGYEVVVLTSNHAGRGTVVEVVDGLTVFRFPRWFAVSNTPVNPLWPLRLRRAMDANRIDLVHAHAPVPFMAEAAALGCGRRPFLLTYHCSLPKGRPVVDAFLSLYESKVLPKLLRRADGVVSVSPPVARWLEPHTGGKAHLVPPGVDAKVFVPPEAGLPEADPGRACRVLFVGRIERASAEKGIPHLLEAFSLVHRVLPDATLELIGGGDAIEGHRRLATSLGILDAVTFRGRVSLAALVEAYQAASVVVLPSTTDSESFGMVLIEAMACARPVIGSRVGGIPYVIDDGNDGYLVPPADAGALAVACLKILQAPELGAALGERGCRKVRHRYTWPSQIEKYRAILDALPSESPVPAGTGDVSALPGRR